MKRYDKVTPVSTRDLLFGECESLRRVQEKLCRLYARHGFREVMTPSLEYCDVFGSSDGQVRPPQTAKLTDSQNRMLCMRPDCTVPIARLCSTKLQNAPLPLRLYYNQQVYSTPREHSGKAAEFSQAGVELIGGAGRESDLEILSLAAESLRELSADYRLEICHIGFFKALMNELQAPWEVKEQVRELIGQKSYATLGDLLEGYASQSAAQALWVLPRLFGGSEILAQARALVEGGEAARALDDIEQLYLELSRADPGEHVLIDLGLVGQADYYTGVIFRGYLAGIGEPVLLGGRYDNLIGQFGPARPAVGFGVNASLVAQSGPATGETKENTVTLALTKGRLERKAVEMLESLGYDCGELHDKGRRLIFHLGESGLQVILAKAADVLTYVESGVADIGIVGKDTILENGGSFYEVLDLGFGRCRFAVACKNGDDLYSGYNAKVIASKYPKVALGFFEEKGMDVDVVKIEGSVELAPILGLADAIVDIVETGSTLKENGLQVVEEIAPVSARLIVNTAAMKLKKEAIGRVIAGAERYVGEEMK